MYGTLTEMNSIEELCFTCEMECFFFNCFETGTTFKLERKALGESMCASGGDSIVNIYKTGSESLRVSIGLVKLGFLFMETTLKL